MSIHEQELSDIEQQLLTAIVGSFGASLFNQQSLVGLDIGTIYAESELKVGLIGLCKKQWVQSMRKVAGEKVFCVPFERYIMFATQLLSEKVRGLIPAIQAEVQDEFRAQDLIMDLVILFSRIQHAEPRFNKKGQLDKKDMAYLMKFVQLSPERLAPYLGLNNDSKLAYPITLALLLDFGLRLGIVYISDGYLCVHQKRLSAWLYRTPADLINEIYGLWFKVHYPEQHSLRQLLIVLPMLLRHEWYSIQQLLGHVDQLEERFIEQYMLALQELGWIRIGRAIDGTKVIISTVGINESPHPIEPDECWYVQPDFEVIVSAKVSYVNHYQLNAYTALISRDQMYIYRISKESIYIAFRHGWTADLIMKHLESMARYGVPENIQISIVEWSKLYRGVQLESVVILRCETSDIADQLMMLPETKGILNKNSLIQPKLFLIPNEDVDFIRDQMNTYGYHTEPARTLAQARLSEFEPSDSTLGIFHSRLRFDMYTQENQYADIASLYPGLAHIPSSWMNSYMAYHMSTKKQLVWQAIEWQCYVRVAHEGKDLLIAPVSIRTDDSTLLLVGNLYMGMIEIPLSSIDAIQLVVPGIHDIAKIHVNNCLNS
jgi:hypothetical protein